MRQLMRLFGFFILLLCQTAHAFELGKAYRVSGEHELVTVHVPMVDFQSDGFSTIGGNIEGSDPMIDALNYSVKKIGSDYFFVLSTTKPIRYEFEAKITLRYRDETSYKKILFRPDKIIGQELALKQNNQESKRLAAEIEELRPENSDKKAEAHALAKQKQTATKAIATDQEDPTFNEYPPPSVEGVQKERQKTLTDFKGRVSPLIVAKNYIERLGYELVHIEAASYEPVFTDVSLDSLDEVARLLGIPSQNIFLDEATKTAAIFKNTLPDTISIGGIKALSMYGYPFQGLLAIRHDPQFPPAIDISTDSHYFDGMPRPQLVDTTYGTLVRIYGEHPVNNSFAVEVLAKHPDLASAAIRQEYVQPKRL